jgi:hypothetical protein
MVSPAEGAHAAADLALPQPADENGSAPQPVQTSSQRHRDQNAVAAPQAVPASLTPAEVIGTPADGMREFARMLGAAEIRKWPLYLRNVKQVMRAATPPFDERAYGFANLTDLLRAAHKDNLVRMERDRQGVIRVFQSTNAPALADAITPPPAEIEPIVITTGPEVVDAPVAVFEDDADPNDVNGNVAGIETSNVPPASEKGKSRRRPQQARAPRQTPSSRRPAAKKKNA